MGCKSYSYSLSLVGSEYFNTHEGFEPKLLGSAESVSTILAVILRSVQLVWE